MPVYGASGQPAQSTFNYDALVSQSVLNYRKTLTDNVSSTNIFFKQSKDKGLWESADGGLSIAEDLMYGLGPLDSYDGYDELPLTPTEGITQAQYPWRQLATPIAISEKERKQNKHRIVNMLTSKLMQADITMQEGWAKLFLQGQLADGGSGNLYTAKVSTANGSSAFDPIGYLISYNPSASLQVGGIDQATNAWWRNYAKASTATTYTQFLQEVLHMKVITSRGPGGAPDIMWSDELTWELFSVAYYQKYLTPVKEIGDYPFPVLEFQGVKLSCDQFMPDVESNTATAVTWGTLYAINSKFNKVRYEEETNFVSTEFQKPVNQDAKFKHILWMGNVTANNRRKSGVLGKIARTLVAP